MARQSSAQRRLALILLAGFLAIAGVGGGYLLWSWHRPLPLTGETYVLEPGTTLRRFAHMLEARGVISQPYTFVLLGHVTGRSRQLKAGEYRFERGTSMAGVLEQVVSGHVISYQLALIEGWTFRQMLNALRAAPKLTSTVSDLSPAEIMARLGQPALHPEGRFFPDTYRYSQGQTDLQILTSAFEKMQATLQKEWQARAPDLPLRSADEALVLASIVEKETGLAEERGLIAGVFINRLRRGMRLQSDPTVIYGLGERFDGNLRLVDLRNDTAYNTYTRGGLPPTPIAMPGRESLSAVLHPADTKALYFVATGGGRHVFSETLEEHNAAVQKYQLGGRARTTTVKQNP